MAASFPYYQRGLRTPTRGARIRIGADLAGVKVSDGNEAPSSFSVVKGRAILDAQRAEAQFVGALVRRTPTNPSLFVHEIYGSPNAADLDEWYNNVYDDPFVAYAVSYVRDPITRSLSLVNEFIRDAEGGSASSTITGPSSGTIVIKDPVPPKSKGGSSGIGWAIGSMAGVLALGLIVSSGKSHSS
jgi:hypothetical protein